MDHRSCKVNIGEEYSSIRELPFSVPQGSCAGAQLFNLYCSTIQEIVNPPLTLHGFANDHAVGNKFKPGQWSEEARCMCELVECAANLKCKTKTLNVDNTEIELADKIKYLGVILDQNLSLKKHITYKCQTTMLNIQHIKNIRHLLTQEVTEIPVLGTVISHLDYCNSILVGLPEVDITKMQHIQNTAAKMVVLNDVTMKDSNSRSILESYIGFQFTEGYNTKS